jgi:hypothetical protein
MGRQRLPDGPVGDAIPVESAIVACCDAFNAMTTDRSLPGGHVAPGGDRRAARERRHAVQPGRGGCVPADLTADPLALGARGPRVAAVA